MIACVMPVLWRTGAKHIDKFEMWVNFKRSGGSKLSSRRWVELRVTSHWVELQKLSQGHASAKSHLGVMKVRPAFARARKCKIALGRDESLTHLRCDFWCSALLEAPSTSAQERAGRGGFE